MSNELIPRIMHDAQIFQCLNDRKPIVVLGKSEIDIIPKDDHVMFMAGYEVKIGEFENGYELK